MTINLCILNSDFWLCDLRNSIKRIIAAASTAAWTFANDEQFLCHSPGFRFAFIVNCWAAKEKEWIQGAGRGVQHWGHSGKQQLLWRLAILGAQRQNQLRGSKCRDLYLRGYFSNWPFPFQFIWECCPMRTTFSWPTMTFTISVISVECCQCIGPDQRASRHPWSNWKIMIHAIELIIYLYVYTYDNSHICMAYFNFSLGHKSPLALLLI